MVVEANQLVVLQVGTGMHFLLVAEEGQMAVALEEVDPLEEKDFLLVVWAGAVP